MINKRSLFVTLVFVASCVRADITHLPFGSSASVSEDGTKVVIDHGFISELKEKPSIRLAAENFWEFIYFINLGEKESLSLGIDILSHELPTDLIHDRYGYQYIARAVSQNDEFWYLLHEKDLSVIKSVLAYFEKYPDQYENMEGFEFMKNKLLKEKGLIPHEQH